MAILFYMSATIALFKMKWKGRTTRKQVEVGNTAYSETGYQPIDVLGIKLFRAINSRSFSAFLCVSLAFLSLRMHLDLPMLVNLRLLAWPNTKIINKMKQISRFSNEQVL
ncbi:hypothetical protein EUGRSUZ_A01192 [Eucalyptus grandis]|uniref:Uncharacterized protein n=2 Tax=Eucalyptus grandis TaxID=71139 RepID=A0ACC3M296_EUCGR|nr:hypothetical protein EUGRSUZ_A01192 [Eucalyptus grandis]